MEYELEKSEVSFEEAYKALCDAPDFEVLIRLPFWKDSLYLGKCNAKVCTVEYGLWGADFYHITEFARRNNAYEIYRVAAIEKTV